MVIKFEDFKEDMNYNMIEFTDENLKFILDNVDCEYKTFSELEEEDLYDEGDFSLSVDSSISSLIDYLNDMDEDLIISLIGNQYGNVIEFYYLTEDEQYVMAVGMR